MSALGDHNGVVGVLRSPVRSARVDPHSVSEDHFLRPESECWMPGRKMECRACGVLQLRDSGNACVRTLFWGTTNSTTTEVRGKL
jgi:hypothetical protein